MGLELHHEPVMMPEIMQALNVQPGGRYIDGTLGEGGHSREILRAADPGGQPFSMNLFQFTVCFSIWVCPRYNSTVNHAVSASDVQTRST
jgi:hypothetical protein